MPGFLVTILLPKILSLDKSGGLSVNFLYGVPLWSKWLWGRWFLIYAAWRRSSLQYLDERPDVSKPVWTMLASVQWAHSVMPFWLELSALVTSIEYPAFCSVYLNSVDLANSPPWSVWMVRVPSFYHMYKGIAKWLVLVDVCFLTKKSIYTVWIDQ